MHTLAGLVLALLSTPASAANILAYSPGAYPGARPSPLTDAVALTGDTLTLASDVHDFQNRVASGAYSLLIVAEQNVGAPAVVRDACIAALRIGIPCIYGDILLESDATAQAAFGVSAVENALPRDVSTGASPDFLRTVGGTLAWPGTYGLSDNGNVLTPVDWGTTVASYASGGGAIVVKGDLIVNGWVLWNFQEADADGDGILDAAEVYAAEIAYLLGPRRSLSVWGTCPGRMSITMRGASGGGYFALLQSSSPGSTPMPSSVCPGGRVDLASPNLVGILRAGPSGHQTLTPTLGPAQCGTYLQAVDLGSCRKTGLVVP